MSIDIKCDLQFMFLLCNFSMRVSRKFCQIGSNLTTFLLVDEGRKDQNITLSGPSSAHKRKGHSNGVSLACDDGPTLNAGVVAL